MNVRLFGSLARGEAQPDSEVDILIALDPERSPLNLVALKQHLEDLLSCKVDVVTEAAVSPTSGRRCCGMPWRCRRGGSMETITLHSRVGADGLLKLQVPVNLTNTELEVVLIVQPVVPASQAPGWPPEFFKEVAGGWQGELSVARRTGTL